MSFPVGPNSHNELKMRIQGKTVLLSQQTSNEFHFQLTIDDSPVQVLCVKMYEDIVTPSDCSLSSLPTYFSPYLRMIGDDGRDAYQIIFNTELIRVGDERRTVDSLLGQVRDDELDASSFVRRFRVIEEENYVSGVTRFYLHNGQASVGFCTCSAFPDKVDGGWQFQVFQLEILYSDICGELT